MIASDNPYLIIFLGAPGSGKGTQTILTAEKFKLLRVEMSKLLERHLANAKPGEKIVANGTDYLIEDQMKRWQEGFLVEAPVVSKILEQELKALLEDNAPYQAKVTFESAGGATGWNAPTTSPWFEQALNEASQTFYGAPWGATE